MRYNVLKHILFLFIAANSIIGQDAKDYEKNFINDLAEGYSNFKNNLEAGGVIAGFNYSGDFFSNVHGGISKGSRFINQFQLSADLKLHKFFNINETIIHASLLGVNGKMPNDLVGSTQGLSNIETENIFKIYDIWIDYYFNEDVSLLYGLFDVNSEFDTKYNSMLFINPSHGIGSEFGLTGENGPSIYPNTSLGFRLNYKFDHDNYIKLGAFDAVPGTAEDPYSPHFDFGFKDGVLFISEFGYDCYSDYEGDTGSNLCINYAIGAWYSTRKGQDFINPNKKSTNFGFYSFLESRILDLGNDRMLSAFMRSGLANPDINQIDLYFSGGFVLSNLFAENDQLGIAFASSKNSRKFIKSQSILNENPEDIETNIELSYLLTLSDHFSLQPDIQYFINPAHNSTLSNSICIGIRTSFNF